MNAVAAAVTAETTTPNPIPLVLLPGLLCDETLWRKPAGGLSDIAHPVIPDLTRDDTIAAMAQQVLAAAPRRFALAGLSMGGYVALEIMRQAPARVTRLALFDTSAAPDDQAGVARRTAGVASAKAGRFVGVSDRLLPWLVHASHVAGPVGEEVKAMAARVGAEAFQRQQQAILGRADSRALLSTIKVPTLVAVGDADKVTPVDKALEIHRGIAGSQFHLFQNCGHLPALEQPAETAEVLRRWLLRAAPPGRRTRQRTLTA